MFRHVVMFTWKPEATAEQKQRVLTELRTLPPLMAGMVAYHAGPDAGLAPGNFDFGVTMASALLCLAVLAAGRSRRVAMRTVAAGGAVLVVVDGAPFLGDDVGGVLALVPALAALAALVARVRVTARRAATG